jgi:hypothetical protein
VNPSNEELLMLVRNVIRRSALPKTVIARDANISRAALNSWIAGVRTPQTNSLRHLAAGLRRRMDVLGELAAELEKAAGEDECRRSSSWSKTRPRAA